MEATQSHKKPDPDNEARRLAYLDFLENIPIMSINIYAGEADRQIVDTALLFSVDQQLRRTYGQANVIIWAGSLPVLDFAVRPEAYDRYHQERDLRILGELGIVTSTD